MDETKKKDLIVNKHVDDKDQGLEFVVEGRRRVEPREGISLWRISNSILVRFHQKFLF